MGSEVKILIENQSDLSGQRSGLNPDTAGMRAHQLCREIDSSLRSGGVKVPTLSLCGVDMPELPWTSLHLPVLAANAYQPDIHCIIPRQTGKHPEYDIPPLLPVSQEACTFLRFHAEIEDKVAEALALQFYLESGATFRFGAPSIALRRFLSSVPSLLTKENTSKHRYYDIIMAGDESLTHSHFLPEDTILIPGCGLTALRNVGAFFKVGREGKIPLPMPKIVLNDNHPFVGKVAEHFITFLGCEGVTFQVGDIGELRAPVESSLIIISFVDEAPRRSIEAFAKNLRKISQREHQICCLTAHGDNYLGEILSALNYRKEMEKVVKGDASHLKDAQGRMIDFCELTIPQAVDLEMGVNARCNDAVLSTWRSV